MNTFRQCLIISLMLCLCRCDTGIMVTGEFPDFITRNEDYFVAYKGTVPEINPDTYVLNVTGLVDHPRSFTIDELQGLPLVELPVTVECIGNAANGPLVGTAVWQGFRLYDFLVSLGLDKAATGVKYVAADGYYASHTLEQIRDSQAIGALFMNAEALPAVQGFPLRILVPGFYGAKQPGWVTRMEVMGRPLEDYWQDRGWDLTPPMDVDSKIFFPANDATVLPGSILEIGGAAFGGTRIATVEVTVDNGDTWQEAAIVQSMSADNVWVFWKAAIVIQQAGLYTINSRATDIYGRSQPRYDDESRDGVNSWPAVRVIVGGSGLSMIR
jgi:DMSO/TMAO reductase YedYZ molybdopterin-dependent catalytic subunit